MNKLTATQVAVLAAVEHAQAANGGAPVYQSQVKKHLGKLPHPNTLDALVRLGALDETRENGPCGPEKYAVTK